MASLLSLCIGEKTSISLGFNLKIITRGSGARLQQKQIDEACPGLCLASFQDRIILTCAVPGSQDREVTRQRYKEGEAQEPASEAPLLAGVQL